MNRSKKIIIALGSIFCLVLLGSTAFAQGDSEFPEAIVGAAYQPTGFSTFEASWLIGHNVTTKEGGDLGQISSLVIDKTNGRIALVVLSDVPNLGAALLPIPYSSITDIGADSCDFDAGNMEIGVASGFSDPYVEAVTRYPSNSKFYGIPEVMDVAWLTEIYRHYGQVPYWTKRGEQSPQASELYETTELTGTEVQSSDGEGAGKINDFVIDSSDGHVALLLLSDVPGRETSLIAVPFSVLSARGENGFVLNTSRDHLALSSGFDEGADLDNPKWAEDVYRFFGQQPYWTVGGEMGSSTMGPPMKEEENMEP